MEGFGQTECMGPIVSRKEERRIGSIGKPTSGIEVRVTEEDELLDMACQLELAEYGDKECLLRFSS